MSFTFFFMSVITTGFSNVIVSISSVLSLYYKPHPPEGGEVSSSKCKVDEACCQTTLEQTKATEDIRPDKKCCSF